MKSLFRFLILMLLTVGLAFADPSKLSKDLAGKDPTTLVSVIVQFKQVPSEVQHQKVKDKGGVLKSKLQVVKGATYSVPAGALLALSEDPDVAYISPDRPVNGALDYAAAAVNANIALQYGYDGSNVGVAVIDSGITPTPDLNYFGSNKSRIVYSQNLAGSAFGTGDDYGHGTHVAGIVAGNGASSTGPSYMRTFTGIAPKAQLINLRVLDANGQGSDSAVIAAIQQAINLKAQYNIRVINLSLGRPVLESYTLDPLCQAVEQAWKAGMVVVVAGGNGGRDNSQGTNGYATITAPGNDPYVITVGAMKTMGTATRDDDLIASYSSKGPTLLDHIVKPDLVAPGNVIISALASNSSIDTTYSQNVVPIAYYKNSSTSNISSSYFRLSGTSMATPVVSGAAALLLQQDPSLTPDQVKARLMKTASKNFPTYSVATDPVTGATYTSQYDIFTVGAGYLDIWAALNNTDLATGKALSPTVQYNALKGTVSVVFGSSVVWGSSLVWGSSVVWGSNVFVNGSSIVWGSSVCWGTSTLQGFSVVWGSSLSLVWGSNQTSLESLSVAIKGEK